MGLSLSSSKKNVDFDRYEWRATHACQTNGHTFDDVYSDHASATGYNFDKGLQLAADGNLQALGNEPEGKTIQDLLTTDGSDFGDKIGFSFWVKPTWSHTGTTTAGNWSNGSAQLPLFQFNAPGAADGTGGQERAIIAYINFRSGTSFRNRIVAWVDDGDDRAGSQRALHDVNSITGTGSTSNSVNSLWDEANPGNTNSEGYVHLVFTRGEQTGGAAWDVYWNSNSLNMNIDTADMTTSISSRFRPMEQISNISAFNTSPFDTWKSAYRECVKLSSKVIDRQEDSETEARLDAWCRSDDLIAVNGALAGKKYGTENKGNKEAIAKINDFAWLEEVYKNAN